MKTQAELDELKAQWESDPIWDIEQTEGFEDHYEELLGYRVQKEEEWEKAEWKRVTEKANSLGVPGNYSLAKYVLELEETIKEMQEWTGKVERGLITLASRMNDLERSLRSMGLQRGYH